jgi:hypothetical protein
MSNENDTTTQASTFRTKVEPTTTESPKQEIVVSGDNVQTHAPELVATYMEDMGKPYVAKYLNIESFADRPEFARDLAEIEGFIKDRVAKGELDNSTKAADKYLKDLERKAGLTTYESTNQRITKLLAYIDFIRTIEK